MTNLLFDEADLTPWLAEWQNMPEYVIEDLEPKFSLIVNFACAADVEAFGQLIGQPVKANGSARQLQSIWVPEQEIGRMTNKHYIERLR